MLFERQQIIVTGNDGCCASSDGTGNHGIIIRVAENDWCNLRCLNDGGECRITRDQIVWLNLGGSQAFEEFLPLQDFFKFGQKRAAGEQFHCSVTG